MPRKKKEVKEEGGLYFDADPPNQYIPTGSTLLNCVLGGGYLLGRVVNIVGDKSTGKTLLAMEAFANFHMQYPEGEMYYVEAEAAFDKRYARSCGFPIDKVTIYDEIQTVEALFEQLSEILSLHEKDEKPSVFILDSLDALSDDAELERDIDKGSFGGAKAKKMSELFRRITKRVEAQKMSLIIISQIRENMNAMFGKKTMRTGGKALDFYATQILYLAHIKRLVRTVKGVKRATGVVVKAQCEKNKIGLPFRNCQFPILFNYGIDDGVACIDWMTTEAKETRFDGLPKEKAIAKATMGGNSEFNLAIQQKTVELWNDIDQSFLPKNKKYGDGS